MVARKVKITRFFKLRDGNNVGYLSPIPGTLGANRVLKIYGKLDCSNALRWLARGHYKDVRVFFIDELTAIAAGYRPCGICMKGEYKKWKIG